MSDINGVSNEIIHISSSKLPTKFGIFTIHIYKNTSSNVEHAVLENNCYNDNKILRIHSECATGDIFFSQRCDCGNQLEFAMSEVAKNGGMVIYLRGQEGRGIGLGNKIKCYNLMDEDMEIDTFKANEQIGFPDDARCYKDVIAILKDQKFDNFVLLTGNQEKAKFLRDNGFTFTVVANEQIATAYNKKYLEDKVKIKNQNILIK